MNTRNSSRFSVLGSLFVFTFGSLFASAVPGSAFAEVTTVTVASRGPVADG
jgi:hypothetical protein